jgi:hypothetical protein
VNELEQIRIGTRNQIQSILTDYAAKLEAEGSSQAIAVYMQAHEVQAFCGSPNRCAVAVDVRNYLAAHGFHFAPEAISVGNSVWVHHENGAAVEGQLGEKANMFIHDFDSACYPDLFDPTDKDGALQLKRRLEIEANTFRAMRGGSLLQ